MGERSASTMLRPGGICTVVGMVPDRTPIQLPGSELFFQEKWVQGSFMRSNQFKIDIPRYLELYRQGCL
ncbi:MAG: hypothetical protein EOP24_32675 [Hyphomicrobiales bacterium]|nr:MAG: hypothetical protein EOP24_32675 [Hyphomicrobiales bacterium]